MQAKGYPLRAGPDELPGLIGVLVTQQAVAAPALILDVGGSAEGPAGTGEHQYSHLSIFRHVMQGQVQLLEHLLVQGVQTLGAVQHQPGDVVAFFQQYRLELHSRHLNWARPLSLLSSGYTLGRLPAPLLTFQTFLLILEWTVPAVKRAQL